MNSIFKTIARWRTWLLNALLALAVMAPEIMNSPEILAVVPQEWQRWFLAGIFLVNIWMRPRPAVLPGDPEAEATKAKKARR